MSISAMNAVWKLTSLPGMDKSVLLALADYANADGLCWPSVETLARKSAWSGRAVQDAVRRLVEKRFLVVEVGIKRGRQTVNRYTVLPGREEIVRGAGDSPLPPSRGAAGSMRGAAGSPLRGAAGSPPLILEPSESEPPQESGGVGDKSPDLTKRWEGKLPAALQKEFDAFYDAYPFKKNRKDAEREFYFARRTTTIETIMEGLTRAKESEEWARVDRDGGSFIPHPNQFLKKERWRDEYKKKMTGEAFGAGIRKFLENQGRDGSGGG